jgi:hypothetical protein
MKFRKKPVVIDAWKWTGKMWNHVIEELPPGAYLGTDESLLIPTLEGVMTASAGDWIIKGVKGEFYPCKPDIFEATYEKVED